ncbi:MAG TPA: hypothetical protein VGQ82_11045 [Chthoniobacterales bacterium]|nr:hypothetical protein [Chthoniobacterales bacterium]
MKTCRRIGTGRIQANESGAMTLSDQLALGESGKSKAKPVILSVISVVPYAHEELGRRNAILLISRGFQR